MSVEEVKEEDEIKDYSPKAKQMENTFCKSGSSNTFRSASPETPKSVLLDLVNGSPARRGSGEFANSSSNHLWNLRVQALEKVSPIDVKRLARHILSQKVGSDFISLSHKEITDEDLISSLQPSAVVTQPVLTPIAVGSMTSPSPQQVDSGLTPPQISWTTVALHLVTLLQALSKQNLVALPRPQPSPPLPWPRSPMMQETASVTTKPLSLPHLTPVTKVAAPTPPPAQYSPQPPPQLPIGATAPHVGATTLLLPPLQAGAPPSLPTSHAGVDPPPPPQAGTTPPTPQQAEATPPQPQPGAAPSPKAGAAPPPSPQAGAAPPPSPQAEAVAPLPPQTGAAPPPSPLAGAAPPPSPQAGAAPPPSPQAEAVPPLPPQTGAAPPSAQAGSTPPPLPQAGVTQPLAGAAPPAPHTRFAPPPSIPFPNRAAGPPPPPGAGRCVQPKKATTKLKRYAQLRKLYSILKEKVDGNSSIPKSSNGRKFKLAGSAAGKEDSMAACLAEIAKRSGLFIQIEEDVKKYSQPINAIITEINTFQTKDITELLKFHQKVESLLGNLSDEIQVLARFESFPHKKHEAVRSAAATHMKFHNILTEMQNWKFDPQFTNLELTLFFEKIEKYLTKVKLITDAFEQQRSETIKELEKHNLHMDFYILVQVKEAMIDISSNCIELALKVKRSTKANEPIGREKNRKPIGFGKFLWRAFQFAFRVYCFAGGQDDHHNNLTTELAREIQTDL